MTSADPEEARRTAAHAFARGALIEARKAAVTAGTEAIKLVAALNAGGLIALLGFLGAISGKSPKVIYGPGVFITPMSWSGAGLALSAISIIGLYFARHFYAEAWFYTTPTDRDPYYHPGANAVEYERRANCWVIVHHVFSVLAFISFAVGMFACLPIVRAIRV